MKTKTIALLLAVALVFGGIVGGTVAWLTDKTDEVKNTFTTSDINITLDESDNLDLKMVPGKTLTKDPVVTVKAGSEACWLFVKIEKENWNYLSYEIADGWTELTEGSGIYYREVAAAETDTAFSVLKNNAVIVSEDLTDDIMFAEGYKAPTLTFTAYACQKEGFNTALDAWNANFATT